MKERTTSVQKNNTRFIILNSIGVQNLNTSDVQCTRVTDTEHLLVYVTGQLHASSRSRSSAVGRWFPPPDN